MSSMSMPHFLPLSKGDPLCPLGFHPQVRWPTRCKRCFRDYKEHGGKRKEPEAARPRKDEQAAQSSPSLPNFGMAAESAKRRTWSSSSEQLDDQEVTPTVTFKRPSSWTSTPDLVALEDGERATTIPTVSLTLPFKRKVLPADTGQPKVAVNDAKLSSSVLSKSDSLAARTKKLQMAAKGVAKSEAPPRRTHLKEVRTDREDTPIGDNDVQFLIKLRSKSAKRQDLTVEPDYDAVSLTGTDTSESTTLIDPNEYDLKVQLDTMRQDLEATRSKCERLEKEKSNILLRRLTAMDATKGNASEVLKLQQKVNELQSQLDDHKDEKKSLNLKVKELEDDLDHRPTPLTTQKTIDELKSKLLAAETLCEELMDENEDMKKELRDMEEEMEEMQDHFREDQVDEYSSLKKELEQTTKNCRILSFKLRKNERKTEQMEAEKSEFENKIKEFTNGGGIQQLDKLKELEKDLSKEKELNNTLQKKLDETSAKLTKATESKDTNAAATKKRTPMLGMLGKSVSSEMRVSRESLTRGGSQDDPVQLLRDLQDSLEREADLREQLKFAEEDSETLRGKSARLEEDNESLVLQLKKMATTRTRPTTRRPAKDETEDDANVIKLQLELNEQETGVLRRKIEELEGDNERLKKKSKELQDKITLKATEKKLAGNFDRGTGQSERVKMLESEMNEIRTKLIEKERDCERLEAEMNLTKKLSKNGNGAKKNPDKNGMDAAADAAQLLKKVKQVERERDKLQKLLDKANENTSTAFKNRKANAPTDITTKMALKTMVSDLENEVSTILASLSRKEDEVLKLQEEVARSKTQKGAKDTTNKELEELTKKYDSLAKERATEKSKLDELTTMLTNGEVEKEEFKMKIAKMKIEQELVSNENKRLETDVAKLKTETSSLEDAKREVSELKERCEFQKLEVERKDAELNKLRNEIDEKSTLSKELTLKTKMASDLQKKLKEVGDASASVEKKLNEKLQQMQSNLDDEKKRFQDERSMTEKLIAEKDNLNEKIHELENSISNKNSTIESLEKDLTKERSATSVVIKTPVEKKELKTLRDEVEKLKNRLSASENMCKQVEKKLQCAEDKVKKLDDDAKTEKLSLEKKIADIESDLQNERRKLQLLKTNADKEHKNYDTEANALRSKLKSLEVTSAAGGSKKISELRQEYQSKIDKMEKQAEKERNSFESLTAKYEVLEEEHVATKARLIADKETLTNQLFTTRKQLEQLEEESESQKKALRLKHDTLMAENSELLKKTTNGDGDKKRYRTLFEQQQKEIEQMKKEGENVHDQMEFMRRENDELRKKLDDYDKVSKIQRNISADSSAMDKEIRDLRQKLTLIEKAKKSEMSECKMRYDNQIGILNEEMHSLTAQTQRFKRERDNYKHMLEGAQKTIGDLKSNPNRKENRNSISSLDDAEEYKSKIASLEQQISCMEDELSESRLEASKAKTELVSERSSWEVRLSEMHSHINELEEEKILSGGRTKVVGVRTRMELSWQKEREDQQRLLQETATLARDLRQTLFELERERDKDALEARRKLEQLKKRMEEEQNECRRKMDEMQGDFMELRDAHAKLRTTNEKLRRDRERHERDREEMKMALSERKRTEQDDLRRIHILVQQVENLLQVAPELFGSRERLGPPFTPTPPKRTKSKSREGSPAMERTRDAAFSRESSVAREERRTQVQATLQRLVDATEELRKVQERERLKRSMHLRRATSSEKEQYAENGVGMRKLNRTESSLHRKSLSLEHTATMHERSIWKTGDDDTSMSSLQSLDVNSDLDVASSRHARDASTDSQLSTGSAQSEIAGGERKKKQQQGLMGKLKKLTKSRSIDDNDESHLPHPRPLAAKTPSNSSDVGEEAKGSKRDLKDRITGMFKRSGSQSRGNSIERQITKQDSSSTQRPLMQNGNRTSISATNSNTNKLLASRKMGKQ